MPVNLSTPETEKATEVAFDSDNELVDVAVPVAIR